MAILTVRINRTQSGGSKSGTVSIVLKSNGTVLDRKVEVFPVNTGDEYILDVCVGVAKQMMRDLAMRQVPANLSFDVDSEQLKLRRLFDL